MSGNIHPGKQGCIYAAVWHMCVAWHAGRTWRCNMAHSAVVLEA
jgi:hypothetical protein